MNTEQLKTAEQILENHSPIFNPLFADDNVRKWKANVVQAMQDFAYQESKIAVHEFKDKLRKDYEDRILLCENIIKQNPRNTVQCLIAICEGVITEYRYLIDKL